MVPGAHGIRDCRVARATAGRPDLRVKADGKEPSTLQHTDYRKGADYQTALRQLNEGR